MEKAKIKRGGNIFGEVDLLHGPIFTSMLLFMVPLLISRIFQQLYNMVDTMIVGHYLGDSALAAMGATTPVYNLLVGFAMGIGTGLATVTSRSFGSGDQKLLKRSTAAAMVIGIGCSLVITLGGSLILHPLLEVLETPKEVIEDSYTYIFIITVSILVMFAYNLCAGLLRAIGNSMMPLVFLFFSSLLNVGLDILFIVELDMGIAGAAVATVLAQMISAILCMVYIWKRAKFLLPEKQHFKMEGTLYKEMLGQGLSVGFMSSIVSLGSVILQYGINQLGMLMIVAYSSARKIYLIFNMFFSSMALAVSTFVSQNRGAGQWERIRKVMRISYAYDVVLTVLITILIYLFGEFLMRLITGTDESAIIQGGVQYLRIVGPSYVILGVLNQSRHALQGLGEKMLPLISSVIELVGKILFVWILIPKYQYTAVIWCEPVIWCVMAVQLVYSLYRNPLMREK